MKQKIIRTAGTIWRLLHEKGEMNIAAIPRALKEKSIVVYQSLGWLAREDNIRYRSRGDRVFVSLQQSS